MPGMLGHLLIISDQMDLARRIAAIGERMGFAVRILSHTLDFEYVVQHWDVTIVALQLPMPDQQEIAVLSYLERFRLPIRLIVLADEKDMTSALSPVQKYGLAVETALSNSYPHDQIEAALKPLLNVEHVAA